MQNRTAKSESDCKKFVISFVITNPAAGGKDTKVYYARKLIKDDENVESTF